MEIHKGSAQNPDFGREDFPRDGKHELISERGGGFASAGGRESESKRKLSRDIKIKVQVSHFGYDIIMLC